MEEGGFGAFRWRVGASNFESDKVFWALAPETPSFSVPHFLFYVLIGRMMFDTYVPPLLWSFYGNAHGVGFACVTALRTFQIFLQKFVFIPEECLLHWMNYESMNENQLFQHSILCPVTSWLHFFGECGFTHSSEMHSLWAILLGDEVTQLCYISKNMTCQQISDFIADFRLSCLQFMLLRKEMHQYISNFLQLYLRTNFI